MQHTRLLTCYTHVCSEVAWPADYEPLTDEEIKKLMATAILGIDGDGSVPGKTCVTVCCIVLQRVALCCSVLQHVAACRSVTWAYT